MVSVSIEGRVVERDSKDSSECLCNTSAGPLCSLALVKTPDNIDHIKVRGPYRDMLMNALSI